MAGWEAGREGAAAQSVGEALALDQLHDQDGNAAVGVLEEIEAELSCGASSAQ